MFSCPSVVEQLSICMNRISQSVSQSVRIFSRI